MSLDKLMDYQHPHLEERLIKEGAFETPQQYQEAFTEFKKYMGLVRDNPGGGIGMESKAVDEIWHGMLMFTKDYQNFCKDYIGRFVHHKPNTGDSKLEEIQAAQQRFITLYENAYGEIPNIWNSAKKAKIIKMYDSEGKEIGITGTADCGDSCGDGCGDCSSCGDCSDCASQDCSSCSDGCQSGCSDG